MNIKYAKVIPLKDYEQMLIEHDWYYMMSEDSLVFKKGSHRKDILQDLSELSNEHKELFTKYQNKHKIN